MFENEKGNLPSWAKYIAFTFRFMYNIYSNSSLFQAMSCLCSIEIVRCRLEKREPEARSVGLIRLSEIEFVRYIGMRLLEKRSTRLLSHNAVKFSWEVKMLQFRFCTIIFI